MCQKQRKTEWIYLKCFPFVMVWFSHRNVKLSGSVCSGILMSLCDCYGIFITSINSVVRKMMSAVPRTVKYGDENIMLWGCLSAKGTGHLIRVKERMNVRFFGGKKTSLSQRIDSVHNGSSVFLHLNFQ